MTSQAEAKASLLAQVSRQAYLLSRVSHSWLSLLCKKRAKVASTVCLEQWTELPSHSFNAFVSPIDSMAFNSVITFPPSPPYVGASAFSDKSRYLGAPLPIATLPSLSSWCHKFAPISPSEFRRYDRNAHLPMARSAICVIKPRTLSFQRGVLPSGWACYTHPEGALYFCKRDMNLYTDANLYDPSIYMSMETAIKSFNNYVATHKVALGNEIDLVFDVNLTEGGDFTYGYYLVNHKNRVVFWFDDYDTIGMLDDVNVSHCPSHIALEIESQYWYHGELFPDNHRLPSEAGHELRDILIHAIGDSLTSSVSTAPYNVDQLRGMLHLVKECEESDGRLPPGSACVIYRLMSIFAHERFLHLHGLPGARLSSDQSIHGIPIGKKTLLFRALSTIFLSCPDLTLEALQKMTVDNLVNRAQWQKFRIELQKKWRDAMLFSALMLNVNFLFLNAKGVGSQQWTVLTVYLSCIASAGCIFSGLSLRKQLEKADIVTRLARTSTCPIRIEMLALAYSIPNALQTWGQVTFLFALGLHVFTVGGAVAPLASIAAIFLGCTLYFCSL